MTKLIPGHVAALAALFAAFVGWAAFEIGRQNPLQCPPCSREVDYVERPTIVREPAEMVLYCPGEIVKVDESGDFLMRRKDVVCPPWGQRDGRIRVSSTQCDTVVEVLQVMEARGVKCSVVAGWQTPKAVVVP